MNAARDEEPGLSLLVHRPGGEPTLLHTGLASLEHGPLLRRLGAVGHDCRRGRWGAGQDASAGQEARADVVHGHGERFGLGLDGLGQGSVVDRLV
ncbi:hypothetical protein ACFXPJ_09405 [Streptomyces goshikiensis]